MYPQPGYFILRDLDLDGTAELKGKGPVRLQELQLGPVVIALGEYPVYLIGNWTNKYSLSSHFPKGACVGHTRLWGCR